MALQCVIIPSVPEKKILMLFAVIIHADDKDECW